MTKHFEFELLEVKGEEAVSKLLELRKQFPTSGNYPFIIGNAEGFQMIEDNAGFQTLSSKEILKKAESIDAPEWFASQKKEFGEFEDLEVDSELQELIGEPPESSPREMGLYFEDRLLAHKHILKRTPFAKVLLGTAEISEPWMLPAFVKFGGWNECPMPEIHCALMKYWQKKYGAEIVSMTPDVIECKVADPPMTEETALKLANEQYLYCPDIVDQGTQTVSFLSKTLRDSDYWYFWWD